LSPRNELKRANYVLFCWLLHHLCPKITAKRVVKNDLNQPIFELQETEIQPAFENLAIDDCSVPPPKRT
jgi:hypothetical protein